MTISKINQSTILENLGFKELNAMQTATTEAAKTHSDLLLLAPTGSGKTVAYLLSVLPLLQSKEGTQVLILAPTRELVLQIETVLKLMKLPVKVNSCYGGHPFNIELRNFTTPPTILVGTPGRIEDHIRRKSFDSTTIFHIIFDEFDKSLEFGFSKQMETIVKEIPNRKGHILVSATKAIEIPEFLNINAIHSVDFSKEEEKVNLTFKQYITPPDEKLEGLFEILKALGSGKNTIVFSNHRDACDRICDHLDDNDVIYSIFHGGLEQKQRELELLKFRNGSSQILIATDVAARGIDIPELDYVIHYQMPLDESTFIHRNGRTARMKSSGTSILLRTDDANFPSYISEEPEVLKLESNGKLEDPEWRTIYISKGKKDKVNKIDLVGYFLQFYFLVKADLGLIEVKDYRAYIAIKRNKCERVLEASTNARIKKRDVIIDIAR